MLFHRDELERIEERTLAPYACLSRSSRGREYPESEPEYRTCFQRDRDRILHTSAFRRLEWKTQVFITYEGDYYRTRLTHTLEVSQIGQSLARTLGGNQDLVEAICLAHDLGHPPFGHSGEAVLARLMADHGGFNHNHQSLRIVTVLENRYPGFPGLNLTWETREGLQKHETRYDLPDPAGAAVPIRGNIESQIANIADELAYTAHDLDDGLRSGILRPEDLSDLKIWAALQEQVGWRSGSLDEQTRHRMIRTFIGMAIEDVEMSTHQRLEAAGLASRGAVQRHPTDIVGYSDSLETPLRELRDRLYEKLYRHFRVMRMAVKAEKCIVDLFEAYTDLTAILPPAIVERMKSEDPRRVVCDYIAGMTDRFALEEHEKLFDPQTKP
jgi:dGTPase